MHLFVGVFAVVIVDNIPSSAQEQNDTKTDKHSAIKSTSGSWRVSIKIHPNNILFALSHDQANTLLVAKKECTYAFAVYMYGYENYKGQQTRPAKQCRK